MKNHYLFLSLALISLLAGCGGGQKIKKEESAHNSPAIPLSEKKDGALLSFFDDEAIPAFEDVETFVLDEDSPKQDTTKLAHANNPSFSLEEPRHVVDKEKYVVFFDYDSNTIKDDQKSTIVSLKKEIKKWIKQGYKVVFRGHSCRWSPKADSVYNMILSNERARSLADNLQVPEDKRTIIGLGFEEPMVIQDVRTKEGQAPNRRVEIYPIAV
jgi:outer membrane protein OmpA-like peptidoglycan-associated protein